MSGERGQAGEGRLGLGRALRSGAPGELGGFGCVGAQWLNRLLVRPRARGEVVAAEGSAAYGPQAGLILVGACCCVRPSFYARRARKGSTLSTRSGTSSNC